MSKVESDQILDGNDRYEGYSKDLIALIAQELNFTFRIELTEDGKYGNYDERTKSWNGLIKDLLERVSTLLLTILLNLNSFIFLQKAHLAICDLTITHQRRSVVDFSSPFMTLGIYFSVSVFNFNAYYFRC